MVSKKRPLTPIPLKQSSNAANAEIDEIFMSDPEHRAWVEASGATRSRQHPHFSDDIHDYEHVVDARTIARLVDEDLTRWRALDDILLAIIRAHPGGNRLSDQQRLSAAKDILQGAARRRPYHPDDEILRAIASEWVIRKMLWNNPEQMPLDPAFESLVREVVEEEYWAGLDRDEKNKIVRRLKSKFSKQRDVLLAEQTAFFHPKQKRREMLVNEIVERLVELGLGQKEK